MCSLLLPKLVYSFIHYCNWQLICILTAFTYMFYCTCWLCIYLCGWQLLLPLFLYICVDDKFSMNYYKWGLLFIYSMMDILHRHYFIWKLCFTLLQLKNFFLHTYHNGQLLYALKCSNIFFMDYGNWRLVHMTEQHSQW